MWRTSGKSRKLNARRLLHPSNLPGIEEGPPRKRHVIRPPRVRTQKDLIMCLGGAMRVQFVSSFERAIHTLPIVVMHARTKARVGTATR